MGDFWSNFQKNYNKQIYFKKLKDLLNSNKEKLLSSKNNPEALQLDFTHFNTFTVFDSMLVRHKWKGFFQYFKEDIENERRLFENSELFHLALSLGMAQKASQAGITLPGSSNQSSSMMTPNNASQQQTPDHSKQKPKSLTKGKSFFGTPTPQNASEHNASGSNNIISTFNTTSGNVIRHSTSSMRISKSTNTMESSSTIDERNSQIRSPEANRRTVERVKSSDDKIPDDHQIARKKKEIPYVLTLTTPSNNPLVEQIRVVKYKILKYFFNERKEFLDKIVNEYFHIFGWTYQTRFLFHFFLSKFYFSFFLSKFFIFFLSKFYLKKKKI